MWYLSRFVRESLQKVFPEYSDAIAANVDPGEWGLENYYCRLVCVFVFMMSVVDDLRESFRMVMLLWQAPTSDDMWTL